MTFLEHLDESHGNMFVAKARNATEDLGALLWQHHPEKSTGYVPAREPDAPKTQAELDAEWVAKQMAIPLPKVEDWQMVRAHEILGDDSDKLPAQPTVREVQDAVCRFFKVSRLDLLSARRKLKVVRPRHVAVYLSKKLTTRSLPDIGRRFGGRDHTTMLNSIDRVEELVLVDAEINRAVALLTAELT